MHEKHIDQLFLTKSKWLQCLKDYKHKNKEQGKTRSYTE